MIELLASSDFIGKLFTPPTADRMELLKWVLNLTFLVHLPYVGMIIAGTTLSLLFNVLHRQDGGKNHLRFAKEVLDLVTVNRAIGVILGIFPLVVLVTCYGQIVYNHNTIVYVFWLAAIVLATAGLAQVHYYREAWELRERKWFAHFGMGAGGVGLLLLAYLIVFANVLLAATPERWPLVDDPMDLVFSWNFVFRFGQFGSLSWALLGAAILFFFFHWGERKKEMDEDYAKFVRRLGLGLGLAFILPTPVLMLVELANKSNMYLPQGTTVLPVVAAFDASIVALVLCMGVGHLFYLMITRKEVTFAPHAFFLCLGVFGAWIVGGQIQMAAALQDYTLEMDEIAQKHHPKLAPIGPVDPATVFMMNCKSCHDPSFLVKSTGPALLKRLPYYRGNKEKLITWIRNGGKTQDRPDSGEFPAGMAKPPGLEEREIAPLADWLLKKLEESEKKNP